MAQDSVIAIARSVMPAPAVRSAEGTKATSTVAPSTGGGELPSDGEQPPVKPAVLDEAVEALNKYVQTLRRDLQFSVDEDSGRTVIKVLDSETKEVIRQFPPEEVLEVARHLGKAEGLIFRGHA